MTKKPRVGDVVCVPLGGKFCFARVLPQSVMAFYDCFLDDAHPDLDEVLKSHVLFAVPVMHSAVKSGRWPVIGSQLLEPRLVTPPAYAKQDIISKAYSISIGGVERPATREECIGLERLAVWSAEHIESRLRDHLAGVPNEIVESFRIR